MKYIIFTILMFEKYKKDNNYFDGLEELNNTINSKGFDECLNTIGVINLDGLVNKFNDSIREFVSYSSEMWDSKNLRGEWKISMKIICEYEETSFEAILNDVDKYAKEFSEGDPLLEQTLKVLWNSGFETKGCCRGHDNKRAYIGIKINDTDKTIKLLSSLNKNDIIITFLSYEGELSCSIKSYNNNDIFSNILNSFDKNIVDNEIEKVINKLAVRKNKDYLNVHFYYNGSTLPKMYINTTDLELINKYKNKFDYMILNEKINMYHFDI